LENLWFPEFPVGFSLNPSIDGRLRQYPLNLLPFEKSCEPLVKELLSQRSIPLPEKIQEAGSREGLQKEEVVQNALNLGQERKV
jgi:hypothetical protein